MYWAEEKPPFEKNLALRMEMISNINPRRVTDIINSDKGTIHHYSGLGRQVFNM